MKDLSKMLTDNKTTTIIVSLLVVLYSALAAPALPNSVILFFDTWYGKLLFMFLIAFVASQNVQVALVVAILFFVILNMATRLDVENFIQQKENFRQQFEYFEDKKSPDLSTDITEQLRVILCKMVKSDKMVNMDTNVKDYVSKHIDKLTSELNITKEALNSMLENMPNTTLDKLCVEKFENEDETEIEGFEESSSEEPIEGFYNNEVLVVNPADPMLEAGAPVDF
jgi:hypothetical protein